MRSSPYSFCSSSGPTGPGWYPAALLLAGLGITDGLDGYVARHFNQVSTLGKVLDPLADRLLLGVAAVAVVVVGAIPLWVGRDGDRPRGRWSPLGFLYVATAGGRRMDVQWAGQGRNIRPDVRVAPFPRRPRER